MAFIDWATHVYIDDRQKKQRRELEQNFKRHLSRIVLWNSRAWSGIPSNVDHYATVNSYPSLVHTARMLWKLCRVETALFMYCLHFRSCCSTYNDNNIWLCMLLFM